MTALRTAAQPVVDFGASVRFQAGHAGSIPVARSNVCPGQRPVGRGHQSVTGGAPCPSRAPSVPLPSFRAHRARCGAPATVRNRPLRHPAGDGAGDASGDGHRRTPSPALHDSRPRTAAPPQRGYPCGCRACRYRMIRCAAAGAGTERHLVQAATSCQVVTDAAGNVLQEWLVRAGIPRAGRLRRDRSAPMELRRGRRRRGPSRRPARRPGSDQPVGRRGGRRPRPGASGRFRVGLLQVVRRQDALAGGVA